MHDIRLIRDDPAAFDAGLARRGAVVAAAALVALDEARRTTIARAQEAQARRNALSKAIGQAKAARDEARAQSLMAEVADLKAALPALEAEEARLGVELDTALAALPIFPRPTFPKVPTKRATRWSTPAASVPASPSRRAITTSSGLRWGSISKPASRWRARASPCCADPRRGSAGHSASSCSTG